MKTMYILCGLPGSGKTTWAKGKIESSTDTIYVNRDDFRNSLFCGKYTFNKNIEPVIKATVEEMVSQALLNDVSVIIDETNLTEEKRRKWIEKGSLYGGKQVIVHFTAMDECLENRMRDPRGISREKWESVINGMKETFEPPTEDEGEIIKVPPFVWDVKFK